MMVNSSKRWSHHCSSVWLLCNMLFETEESGFGFVGGLFFFFLKKPSIFLPAFQVSNANSTTNAVLTVSPNNELHSSRSADIILKKQSGNLNLEFYILLALLKICSQSLQCQNNYLLKHCTFCYYIIHEESLAEICSHFLHHFTYILFHHYNNNSFLSRNTNSFRCFNPSSESWELYPTVKKKSPEKWADICYTGLVYYLNSIALVVLQVFRETAMNLTSCTR